MSVFEPHFVIKTEEIPEGGGSFEFTVTSAFIDSVLSDSCLRGDPGAEEGRLLVHVHRTGASASGELAVSGRLEARVVAECARCLGDVPIDVSVRVRLSLSLLSARDQLPEELELTPEDLERDYYDGLSFSFDDFVRESLLLEVPMKPLCTDGCEGIDVPAHVCGEGELGIAKGPPGMDARLAPLLELKRALGKNADAAPASDPNKD